jgi:hypothetical protein
MFVMSVWALSIAVYEGFILKTGHPSIPWISMILIVLSLMVAIETGYSFVKNRKRHTHSFSA